ncbi:MAG: hypothetical protein M3Y20_05940 [Actinomycetota bacterium]|nr:hypothetical protein [Actinomycetota bacterium]
MDTAEEEPPTGADPAPETGGDEPVADGEPSVDPDDSRFGADLDTTAQAIVDSLENATGYVVVGSTVTITFSEGEAEGLDGMMDCLSVGGLLTEDETLVLAYPDGEKTC